VTSFLVSFHSRYLSCLPLSSYLAAFVFCHYSRPGLLPSLPLFFSCASSPILNANQVTNDKKSNNLLLPRYRTKCRRLEREAEQGLSAHPHQEPLVCDTSYSTSPCVLFVSRFVTTRSDSFEPVSRISVERDEGNQRTACESG